MTARDFKDSQSLGIVKSILEQDNEARKHKEKKDLANAQLRAEGMRPLLQALTDLGNQYLRISVMRHLWPDDFQSRDDRIRGLVLGYDIECGQRCGVKMLTPAGTLVFSTEINAMGNLVFLYSREGLGTKPIMHEFSDQEVWMKMFFRQIAEVIEPES